MSLTRQGTSIMTLLCALIGLIVILQTWLVSASLDALLGGDAAVLVPAALASIGLAGASGVMLFFGRRYDRRHGDLAPGPHSRSVGGAP